MESLSKNYFWNAIQKEYPDAFTHFNKWLYSYYKKINWQKYMPNAKFYDLPIELQVGILFKYFDMLDYADFNTDELKESFRDKQNELNEKNL